MGITDDRYVEGSSRPISRNDDEGSTFQERLLDSRASCEVLKNCPGSPFLRTRLASRATDIAVVEWQYCWAVTRTAQEDSAGGATLAAVK